MTVVTTTTTSSFRLLTGTQQRRGNRKKHNNAANHHGVGRQDDTRNSLLSKSRRCLGFGNSVTSLGGAAFLLPTLPTAVGSSITTSGVMVSSVFPPDVSTPQVVLGIFGLFVVWLYLDGGDDRMRERRRLEQEEAYNKYKLEQYRYCHVDFKEHGWSLDEIAKYKEGTRPKTILLEENEKEEDAEAASNDDSIDTVDSPNDTTNDNPHDTATEYYDGPILLAVDGTVYNVYKGRNFYGPGGEYAIFAGRDATRLLAKGKLDEETDAEQQQPLNIAERAVLATWIYTFQNKYDIVGPLHDYDRSQNSL